MVALLGANGAGKSTMLKSISGLLRAERGRSAARRDPNFLGRSSRAAAAGAASARHRAGAGRPARLRALTPDENLIAGFGVRGSRHDLGAPRDRVYKLLPAPGERRAAAVGLSLGRRAADARHRPRADDAAEAPDARRAELGLAPLLVEIFDIMRRHQQGRACRCCWSSRTRSRRWRSPPGLPDGERPRRDADGAAAR